MANGLLMFDLAKLRKLKPECLKREVPMRNNLILALNFLEAHSTTSE